MFLKNRQFTEVCYSYPIVAVVNCGKWWKKSQKKIRGKNYCEEGLSSHILGNLHVLTLANVIAVLANVILNARIKPQFTWHHTASWFPVCGLISGVRRHPNPCSLWNLEQIGVATFHRLMNDKERCAVFMQRATTNAQNAPGRQVKQNKIRPRLNTFKIPSGTQWSSHDTKLAFMVRSNYREKS